MSQNESPRPKPAPPKTTAVPKQTTKKPVAEAKTGKDNTTAEKPRYVRRPHLTEKPFRDSEQMQALQKKLGPVKSKAFKSKRPSSK